MKNEINEIGNKVIDLQIYRYKKINQENIDLQNQMTEILLAGKSHMQSQKSPATSAFSRSVCGLCESPQIVKRPGGKRPIIGIHEKLTSSPISYCLSLLCKEG